MATAFLSPILNDAQFSDDGTFLVGGLIWVYEAGTTTPATAYTGPTEVSAWTNPIVLNARGETGGEIWLDSETTYKLILEAPPLQGSTHGVVISTFDNINGVYVPPPAEESANWIEFDASTPVYLTATSFSVTGDQTSIFQFNRRIKAITSGGPGSPIFATVRTAVYSSGVTTVTVVCDSGNLDNGLTIVYYGFIESDPSSIPKAVLTGSYASATTDEIYMSEIGGRLAQAVNTASPSTNWPIDVTGDLTGNVTGNVTGNLTGNVTGNVTGDLTGNVNLLDGTAAAPSFRLNTSNTTGFYRSAANVLGFSANGVAAMTFAASGVAVPDGTAGAPSVSFLTAATAGLYKTSTSGLGFSVGGSQIAQIESNGLELIAGSVLAPSLSIGSSSAGLYSSGASAINFSSSGSAVGGFNSTGVRSLNAISATVVGKVTTVDDFVGFLGTNGHQVLASGLLIQWGTGTIPASPPTVTITTPYAGSTIYSVVCSPTGGAFTYVPNPTITSATTFDVVSSVGGYSFYWISIGAI